MNIPSGETSQDSPVSCDRPNSPIGQQLVNRLLELKAENRLYKCLNRLKDKNLFESLGQFEELKKTISAYDETIKQYKELICKQKIVIVDQNEQVDKLANLLEDAQAQITGNQEDLRKSRDDIQSLARKLKEAESYIEDQNFAIDALKNKMYEMKNEYDGIKNALKQRFLERLDNQEKEMEKEKELMAQKLQETREFYDAEGKELNKKIRQLNEELDLISRANLNKKVQVTSERGRGRTRPSSSVGRMPKRGRGRGPTKQRKTKVDIASDRHEGEDGVLEYLASQKKVNDDLNAATVGGSDTERSLSPMNWLSPR